MDTARLREQAPFGIEVVHQADAEKLRKEQKRARKEARQAQRVRSLEKLVLTGDLDNLTLSGNSQSPLMMRVSFTS